MPDDQAKYPSALKLSLMTRQLREEHGELSLLASDPIAIVGMACRFPGNSDDPEAFWDSLAGGVDAITEVPPERWDASEYFDPDPAIPGKANSRWGGFLSDIDKFDPAAFGIAPKEAAFIDPQQRLLLEVAWEAFDDAGWPLETLHDTKTGVFFALYGNDYTRLQFDHLEHISAHTVTGTAASVASGRLSYLFDLRGPSIVVDTACSSSLVAIHLAMQSIRSGESSMAIAGGVSLILTPEMTVSMAKWGMLAPDGRCKTFDANANGFVRGEGCGLVVLKRLSDALRDSDRVHAVIRGSASNQDGRSNVLTAPNGEAQREVIREALLQARVSPDDISYVECHGTGTKVGDPIEVEALADVIGSGRTDSKPCILGAVKANIGHLEAAAGVAGIIKTVLCMRHRAIPPQLHFNKLNPLISMNDGGFQIPTATTAWECHAKSRLAGVSSFGFAGSNAHMIVEDAAAIGESELPRENEEAIGSFLLPISAKHAKGIARLANDYIQVIQGSKDRSGLVDMCFTASTRRSHFAHRFAAVGKDARELIQSLEQFRDGLCQSEPVRDPKIGFVYSGQGSNWHGMARVLLNREGVFRNAVNECDTELRAIANWSILEELQATPDNSRLEETAIFQPVLFAIQVGLAALWESWGIRPHAVTGHSVGEIAAAHNAGILSTTDAIRVVEMRARLMQGSMGKGAMAAVGLSARELSSRIQDARSLSVAASNGPSSSTLSGDRGVLLEKIAMFETEGIFCRELDVGCAFHSEHMEPYVLPLMDGLQHMNAAASRIPFFSTVNGLRAGSGHETDVPLLNAGYWGRNLRDPVLFNEAIGAMIESGCTAFVEIGPHAVLSAYVAEISADSGSSHSVFASMRRNQDCGRVMREALAGLFAHGCDLNWKRIAQHGNIVSLPNYPWQKERYWLDWISNSHQRDRSKIEGMHPLLGQRIDSPAIEQTIFHNTLGIGDVSFLDDHRIGQVCVLPAAAMIEMMLSAGNEMVENDGRVGQVGPASLCDFRIDNALILVDGISTQLQLVAARAGNGIEMCIYGRPVAMRASWTLHAAGRWIPGASKVPVAAADQLPKSIESSGHSRVDSVEFYSQGRRIGLHFGKSFHVLSEITVGDGAAIGHIRLPGNLQWQAGEYAVHPVVLDGCLQIVDVAVRHISESPELLIPVSIGRIEILQPIDGNIVAISSLADVSDRETRPEFISANVDVHDEAGTLLARIREISLKVAGNDVIERFRNEASALATLNDGADGSWMYRVLWHPETLPPAQAGDSADLTRIICTNEVSICEELVQQLDEPQTSSCVHILHPREFPAGRSSNLYPVDPEDAESFQNAIREIREKMETAASPMDIDVVFMWDMTRARGYSGNLALATPGRANSRQLIAAALHLAQALIGMVGVGRIRLCIVTKGAHSIGAAHDCNPLQAALWGLAATVQLEHPELNWVLIDMDMHSDAKDDALALIAELQNGDAREDRIAYRNGSRHVARLTPYSGNHAGDPDGGADEFQMRAPGSGVIEDLAVAPLARSAPGRGEIEIETHAIGINFRDVLSVLNEVDGADDLNLGAECAGRVVAIGEDVDSVCVGDSVMAFAVGGFASHVLVPEMLVTRIPASMDFVEAAGIPVVFLTARYALEKLAKLRDGQRILIHAATGGVGLAALQIARNSGASVIATAGSEEKRNMLRSLGIKHVFDSRSDKFAEQLRRITAGEGVDVVLNSLAGAMIPAGLSVVSEGGIFIEMGKRDDWDQKKVALQFPGIRYCRFDLAEIAKEDPALIASMFNGIVAELDAGSLSSLPTWIFPRSRTVDAFRTMAQGRHIGKLVVPISQRPGEDRELLDEDATYLITGGLGALGLDIAERLVADGAINLVLTGRSRGSANAVARIEKIRSAGVRVEVEKTDVGDLQSMTRLFAKIESSMPTLRGVVHCAGELNDAAFVRQSWKTYLSVMHAKIGGAWILHELTRTRCLDFFVMFSSAAAVVGWPGQSNYGSSNAYMDALAHYRRARGQTALSINWGAWESAGMAAQVAESRGNSFISQGLLPHSKTRAIDSFVDLTFGDATQVLVGQFDWTLFAGRYPANKVPRIFDIVCGASPSRGRSEIDPEPSPATSILDDLTKAPAGQHRRVLARYVEQQAAATLGFPSGHAIDRMVPLNEQGLDSLLAVALRNRLAAALNESLPASLLFDFPTITVLLEHLASDVLGLELNSEREEAQTSESDGSQRALEAEIVELSDTEAEDLLQQELENLTESGARRK